MLSAECDLFLEFATVKENKKSFLGLDPLPL